MYPAIEHAKDEARKLGLTQDEALFFQIVSNEMLMAIADGRIDAKTMAREELACRGFSHQGKWVGFAAAEQDMEQER